MERLLIDDTLEEVRARLEANDWVGAADLIEALRPPDQADIFSELNPEQQETLLPQLELKDAADILEELEDEAAAEVAGRLSVETLSPILDEMELDEAADLLGDLEPEQANQVLAQMLDADDVRPLLLHADETAGGLMTSEFIALREHMLASQALQSIRTWAPEIDALHTLFVVDSQNHLRGVINLIALIKADPTRRLSEIMSSDVIQVPAEADQEECAQLMSRYDLYALPVVDAEQRLIGVITVDDLVDVLVDEQTEDIQRLGGMSPLEAPYLDTPVWRVASKRVGWLMMLFVTGTLTGTVLRQFEGELASVVALTFFIPLLIGTGGNAGSQTTATIIRALAVGEIRMRDALRVLWHECRAGLLLGCMMAVIAFIRAYTWNPSLPLAAAVSVAVLVIVLWATSVGSLLPILAARLKIDPTVVSGPFMSTLVDATGLFIYLSVAKLILRI
jgi:magnesium transporter